MDQIHSYGANKYGANWLVGNETAIHAAVRLGVDHTLLQNKMLLSLVTLHVMETFMNPNSPYTPVQRIKLIPIVEPLPDKLATLLLMAVKQMGSYDPKEALPYIEEQLTVREIEISEKFLNWVVTNEKKFGRGNLAKLWEEHQLSLQSK